MEKGDDHRKHAEGFAAEGGECPSEIEFTGDQRILGRAAECHADGALGFDLDVVARGLGCASSFCWAM